MSFIREYAVKALRKPNRCDVCRQLIETGSPAIRWAGVTDGDFGTCIYHPECRAAEIGYNRMINSGYDDWCPLSEHESDDKEWIASEHPLVFARFYPEVSA